MLLLSLRALFGKPLGIIYSHLDTPGMGHELVSSEQT